METELSRGAELLPEDFTRSSPPLPQALLSPPRISQGSHLSRLPRLLQSGTVPPTVFVLAELDVFEAWFCSNPGGPDGEGSVCNAGDPGSLPGSGRSPGEGHGNPLWYSCLENPMDKRAWRATWTEQTPVHGVEKSWTRVSNYRARAHTHTHTHTQLFCSLLLPLDVLGAFSCIDWGCLLSGRITPSPPAGGLCFWVHHVGSAPCQLISLLLTRSWSFA